MATPFKNDPPFPADFAPGQSTSPTIETLDAHTCDWSEWRKPTGDMIGSCHEYRVCLLCGAVDAAGEPEYDDDDDDETGCEHTDCVPDFENGYLICHDCDATIRHLTDEEMSQGNRD